MKTADSQTTQPLPASAQRLYHAIRSFERADTEYRRARNADAQPRLNKAGSAFRVAKARLFKAAEEYALHG
jgi:hypothetical protein